MNISVTLNPDQTILRTVLDVGAAVVPFPIEGVQAGMGMDLDCRVKIDLDNVNGEISVTAIYNYRAERSLPELMDDFKKAVHDLTGRLVWTGENKEAQHLLTNLSAEIHTENRDKGFWDHERPLTETTMLIVSELAEAVEEEREGREDMWYGDDGKPEGVDVELVDALIRLLDLLGSRYVDVDLIMREKRAYNRSRPKKHGKEY